MASCYNSYKHQKHRLYLEDLKKEFMVKYNNPSKLTGNRDNYEIIVAIGKGTFGMVLLVRNKQDIKKYQCMKAITKSIVIEKSLRDNILLEKRLMQCAKFPFILPLDDAFKDNMYVYIVTPFISGGELFNFIKKSGCLRESISKFYASQIVLAIEYLHYIGIIHRDVKPENILIAANGYVVLTDFGFSKFIDKKTWTLCGTPQYLAPELILSEGYTFSVDWWTIGVLIYEMCAGFPPFTALDSGALYDKILEGSYKCPSSMSPECKKLLKGLLQVDPSRRFGTLKAGSLDVKSHSWFSDIDWESILLQKYEPEYIPPSSSEDETVNFPETQMVKLKRVSVNMYDKEFEDF